MKDAYSFDLDQAGARHSYNKMFVAYLRTFERFGLTAIPMLADTGPIGGDLSPRVHHSGLDRRKRGLLPSRLSRRSKRRPRTSISTTQRRCRASFDQWTSLYAATSEKHEAAAFEALPEASRISRARHRGRPYLLFRRSNIPLPMKAVVNGPDGREHLVHMGSYGIGPSRLVGRVHRGEPRRGRHHLARHRRAVPRRAHQSQGRRRRLRRRVQEIYAALEKAGVDVLYDDRDERPAAKFAAMDLIGAPHQVIIGPKSLGEGKVELKARRSGERELLSIGAAIAKLGGTT